jgi:putative CocE/NonD family hydrolase
MGNRPAGAAAALAMVLGASGLPFSSGAVAAAPSRAPAVSRPGAYSGYSEAAYDGYVRSSFYVPMRDGVRLAVDLFRPTRGGVVAGERLPVVWMHTPYNRRDTREGPTAERYPGFALKLVKYGYVVAVVDFRGLYASYGRNRAYNRGEWTPPATTDAYDITEWLARQPWSSGKIGMWGCSATGGSQMQAATTRPPSLKAIMPLSAEFDVYTFEGLGGVTAPGPVTTAGGTTPNANAARDAVAAPVDGPDGRALLAEAVAQHKDNVESPGALPFRDSWSEAMGAKWWISSSASTYLKALQEADFGVYAGENWDEAGTKPGGFYTLNNLPKGRAKLVVGPETHCGWAKAEEETGFSIVTEEHRFFDYWLKGVRNGVMSEPAVTYYTYNAPKDSEWRPASGWPLPNQRLTDFYLSSGGLAPGTPPPPGAGSTPMSPPAPATVIFISPQSGGLSFQTAPLTADQEITGDPVMHLWISTKARDADAMARIEDVAPDGSVRSYQMLGRLRASGRALAKAPYNAMGLPWHSFLEADARPLEADVPTELDFGLLPMSYIFRAGHRIRLTLTFTDPARSPAGAPEVRVLWGGARASRLTLPLIPAGAGS